MPAADESAPAEGDTAYPRLDAPARVRPGEELVVTVGLAAGPDDELVSTGGMDLPLAADPRAEVILQVSIQFDPAAFALLGSSEPRTLRRTADDPFPTVEVRLLARAGDDLRAERRVEAKFVRDGQLIGFASRVVVVAEPAPAVPLSAAVLGAAGMPPPPPPPPPPQPAAALLDLGPLLDEELPDLTLVIRPASDVAGNRLVFTAHSRHDDIADVAMPSTTVLVGEHTGGTTPEQLGKDSRLKVATTSDERDLFTWLKGMGDRIYRSVPDEVRQALHAAVEKGTADAPASVLLLTEEPHIPWELAVAPGGWGSPVGGASPFLGAHVAISRWYLGELPPPSPRPPSRHRLVEKVLVTAHYEGVVGWDALPHAEAEIAELTTALAPGVTVVPPDMGRILDLLDGTPPADLLHFALHGTFDPQGLQGGVVLLALKGGAYAPQLLQDNHVRSAQMTHAPFVYLNACQVAAGDDRALGDYGGLAAAFLAGGACGVVAPLWNVRDETASALAQEFYRLVTGPDALAVAEVLRRFRARYTASGVRAGTAGVDATLVAFQFFGHPRMRLAQS